MFYIIHSPVCKYYVSVKNAYRRSVHGLAMRATAVEQGVTVASRQLGKLFAGIRDPAILEIEMLSRLDIRTIDITVFAIANLVNVLLAVMFVCRAQGMGKAEQVLGLVFLVLVIPVALAAIRNFASGRDWWTVVLPTLLVLFGVVELVLDVILKSDFRVTRWLWPYIVLYYLALLGMVGYSFLAGRTFGFITLSTYFLNLFATWYSYGKVGHG